jgi:lipoprotein-anchoring transpeptidase ErfK/SrfK
MPMLLSRRDLLASLLAAGLMPAASLEAAAEEPFPVNAAEVKKLAYKWQRRDVEFATREPAGTIVIDHGSRFLYHVLGGGMATRYGVSVGKGSKAWFGETVVARMVKWPVWTPTPDHLERYPSLAKWSGGMPGGPENPMGARALYLFQGDVDTTYRIHGGTKPRDIGRAMTAGCFGLLNIDAIHLCDRVAVGARVVVTRG